MKSATPTHFDVIVLGAGAAGLMCALEAGKRGRRVLVLEHNDRVGKKIRISGGGRCNFTNLHAESANYLSGNPHFAKSALARFKPEQFIALVERHGIAYHEKKLGQLFCDGSAQQIIDLLLKECRDRNVTILLKKKAGAVTRKDAFTVQAGDVAYSCESLVVATGGLSIPPLGVTDIGYRIAGQFGLKIIPPYPALVPLLFNDADRKAFKDLSGVSLEVIARCGKNSFRENMLFTHRGLSGPAILQISSYWDAGEPLVLDLCPDHDMHRFLTEHRGSNMRPANFLAGYLPKRFADIFAAKYLPDKRLSHFSDKERLQAAKLLHNWNLTPAGTEGFAKAEVTAGGVDTDELSSKTMEAKKMPGLYFIGEVVDVTGQLGGYNFQWAWASGFCAGQYA